MSTEKIENINKMICILLFEKEKEIIIQIQILIFAKIN